MLEESELFTLLIFTRKTKNNFTVSYGSLVKYTDVFQTLCSFDYFLVDNLCVNTNNYRKVNLEHTNFTFCASDHVYRYKVKR